MISLLCVSLQSSLPMSGFHPRVGDPVRCFILSVLLWTRRVPNGCTTGMYYQRVPTRARAGFIAAAAPAAGLASAPPAACCCVWPRPNPTSGRSCPCSSAARTSRRPRPLPCSTLLLLFCHLRRPSPPLPRGPVCRASPSASTRAAGAVLYEYVRPGASTEADMGHCHRGPLLIREALISLAQPPPN